MTIQQFMTHFGLHANPFSRAVPDGALLHHRSFAEALARLRMAVEAKTPAVFTAEPGLGKSTLLGALADGLDKDNTRIVYTPLSSCGPFGLIGQLAVRYGLKAKRSAAQTAQAVLDDLARSEKIEVLILDEGQLLPGPTLDELRLLGNLDFDRAPPFCLLLAGQTVLREHLADPDLASLWQRLSIRTSLSPLSAEETTEYIQRRLRATGAQVMLFRPAAVQKVFEYSRGVPREINNVGLTSLLAAATAGRKHIDLKDIEAGIFELENK